MPLPNHANEKSMGGVSSKVEVKPPDYNTINFTAGEEEHAEPPTFERSKSSPSVLPQKQDTSHDKGPELSLSIVHKVTLYETTTRYYLVGADVMDRYFKILKIDRTSAPGHLTIFEDDIIYDKSEMSQLLDAIEDGNKGVGGLKVKCSAWGLLGFIRFTEAYYMLLITKRRQVAMLGGHYVYKVEGTDMVPLTTGSSSRFQANRNPDEARFLSILNAVDLTQSFYFSYGYNITRSLQENIIAEREALNAGLQRPAYNFNDMFVWNHHLLGPAKDALKKTFDWCLPITHGFIDQTSLDIFGRNVYITIIARRSRFFAGARFLKRGVNDLGYVANDVETEQIVSEILTTSFHAPGPRLYANPTYTSYVHHRGSIPLYWTQDNSGVNPKPDIEVNLSDPFYSSAALHFDNLFERYGAPVYVLNLIKARERTPRESKLLHEFQNCIKYLNQSLPKDKKIFYEAFDMSRASKTRGQDVIGTLEFIAEKILQTTGFFHNGGSEGDAHCVQNGVSRTNCIDCLDRTNAAQFVIGKRALGRQLQALGVIAGNTVEYDTDAVNIFTQMFHDHGDTIAIQYGGSHLVNTMATYRKLNQWQSHSRDMVESFKRYYHNSFLDSQRQEAYNLFLGNYIWVHGQPMLWELQSDYYLHHGHPRLFMEKHTRDYIKWFTPQYLEPRTFPPLAEPDRDWFGEKGVEYFDDYWLEYYRPLALTSIQKLFSYKMISTNVDIADRSGSKNHDLSPFRPRKGSQHGSRDDIQSPLKRGVKKGVTIVDPTDANGAASAPVTRPPTAGEYDGTKQHSILRESTFETSLNLPPLDSIKDTTTSFKPADKALMAQWTLNQFYTNSLNPSVSAIESEEYQSYVSHPLNLPLVVSTDITEELPMHMDFVQYVSFGEKGVAFEASEDVEEFREFLRTAEVEDPLSVSEEDVEGRKRYKAYRQWLRGKSLFKQSKVDPEYKGS